MEVIQNRTESIIDYFLSHIEELKKLSKTEEEDVLQLASLAVAQSQSDELVSKSLELLYYSCFYFKQMELKVLWNIYWLISSELFTNEKIKIKGALDELYALIFNRVSVCFEGEYEQLDMPDNDLIVLTTNQFLMLGHAPTMRVLDYAYELATSLKKRVKIVNTAEYSYCPCDYIVQKMVPNYISDYNSVKEIDYRGISFPFMQIPGYIMPDLEWIRYVVDDIYLSRPGLVYNIGASSLISDLCSNFTKTACFPCSTDIPISMSRYLLVGRKLKKSDQGHLNRLAKYQEVIETVVNYRLEENDTSYGRAQFGLSERDFVVCLVGNRLDIEISQEFISFMDKVLKTIEVHFLIIGAIDEKDKIVEKISKKENIHFTGALPKAGAAIKLCDIYCNLKRNGGGRSSFEALAQGVPVITLRFGDVYYTCGEEFSVDSYDEYLDRLIHYVDDRLCLEKAKDRAMQRAAVLSDLTGAQKEILRKIFGFKE